jgi:hypothetical protein
MSLASRVVNASERDPARPSESDSELIVWAERLVMLDQGRSLPELLVRLRQLAESNIDFETRYRILRSVKRPLLKAAASMAKVPHRGGGLSLEQRLYGVMVENLSLLLEEIDRRRHGGGSSWAEQRGWTLRNLIRFLQRQLFYSVHAGTPWPSGAWLALHDLFVCLVVRGSVKLHRELALVPTPGELDPEQAYKWTLLVGLATERLGAKAMDAEMLQRLQSLAGQCRLVDSDGMVGEFGLIVVEVGQDHPPRFKAGALNDAFRGWVLKAPESLIALLCGAILD